jgi:hypothetical protein
MTYRERRERRAERLRGWADSRDAESAASFAQVDRIADGIPFGQPILVGHHSERRARRDQDRIHAGMRAGIDHADKAAEMRSRAANIEAAAGRAIYSDDIDAAERLAERIAELEAERDRIKAYNASARTAAKTGAVGDLSLLDDRQRADLLSLARVAAWQTGPGGAFPAYKLSNLAGNIGRLRERLALLDRPAHYIDPARVTVGAGPYFTTGIDREPRLLVLLADGTCGTCGRPESGHDQRHDLPGSPVLCLA